MMVPTDEMLAESGFRARTTVQPTLIVLQQGELSAACLPANLVIPVATAANWEDVDRISREGPCCVLVDLDLDSDAVLEQLASLQEDWIHLACIGCSRDTSVQKIVNAMRIGCVDFVSKPVQPGALMAACVNAFRVDSSGEHSPSQIRERLTTLTDREFEVLKLFIEGQNTKVIAKQLGVSYQTIDKHRNRALKKMRVGSLIDFARALHCGCPK